MQNKKEKTKCLNKKQTGKTTQNKKYMGKQEEIFYQRKTK
jgi:hypothetical protein